MAQIVLAFDVVNRRLVPNYRGSATALRFGQSAVSLRVYLIKPGPSFVTASVLAANDQYVAYDSTAFDYLRFGLWSDSTGTLEDGSDYLLALTTGAEGFTYNDDDADYPYYEGELNCRTQQVADFLGSAKTATCYCAVNLALGVSLYPVFDHSGGLTNAVLDSATDDGGGTPVDVTQLDAITGGALLGFVAEQEAYCWRDQGVQALEYLLGHFKRTFSFRLTHAHAIGYAGQGSDTVLELHVDNLPTGETITLSAGAEGVEVEGTVDCDVTVAAGSVVRWLVNESPLGAAAMSGLCVMNRIIPLSAVSGLDNANWRTKDGQLQIWDSAISAWRPAGVTDGQFILGDPVEL